MKFGNNGCKPRLNGNGHAYFKYTGMSFNYGLVSIKTGRNLKYNGFYDPEIQLPIVHRPTDENFFILGLEQSQYDKYKLIEDTGLYRKYELKEKLRGTDNSIIMSLNYDVLKGNYFKEVNGKTIFNVKDSAQIQDYLVIGKFDSNNSIDNRISASFHQLASMIDINNEVSYHFEKSLLNNVEMYRGDKTINKIIKKYSSLSKYKFNYDSLINTIRAKPSIRNIFNAKDMSNFQLNSDGKNKFNVTLNIQAYKKSKVYDCKYTKQFFDRLVNNFLRPIDKLQRKSNKEVLVYNIINDITGSSNSFIHADRRWHGDFLTNDTHIVRDLSHFSKEYYDLSTELHNLNQDIIMFLFEVNCLVREISSYLFDINITLNKIDKIITDHDSEYRKLRVGYSLSHIETLISNRDSATSGNFDSKVALLLNRFMSSGSHNNLEELVRSNLLISEESYEELDDVTREEGFIVRKTRDKKLKIILNYKLVPTKITKMGSSKTYTVTEDEKAGLINDFPNHFPNVLYVDLNDDKLHLDMSGKLLSEIHPNVSTSSVGTYINVCSGSVEGISDKIRSLEHFYAPGGYKGTEAFSRLLSSARDPRTLGLRKRIFNF